MVICLAEKNLEILLTKNEDIGSIRALKNTKIVKKQEWGKINVYLNRLLIRIKIF